jgi:hypothetical protein
MKGADSILHVLKDCKPVRPGTVNKTVWGNEKILKKKWAKIQDFLNQFVVNEVVRGGSVFLIL